MTPPDASPAALFEERVSPLTRVITASAALGRFFRQKRLGGVGLVIVLVFSVRAVFARSAGPLRLALVSDAERSEL